MEALDVYFHNLVPYGLMTLLTGVIIFLISLNLIYRGFKAPMVRATFLFCICLVLWLISGGCMIIAPHFSFAAHLGRSFFFGWVFIPVAFLNIAYVFIGRKEKYLLVFFVLAVVFAIAALLGVIHEVHHNYFGFYAKLKFPWNIIINAYYFTVVGYALGLLYVEYRRASTSMRRNQAWFLWFGTSIGFMFGLSETNYVVSSMAGMEEMLITWRMHGINFFLQLLVVIFYVMEIISYHYAIKKKKFFIRFIKSTNVLYSLILMNLLLSWLMHRFAYPLFPWGHAGIIVAFLLISYAILRYRLIDVTDLFQRLLVYLVLSALFFGIWVLFITYTTNENTSILISILYGLLIVALFNPMYVLIQRFAKRVVFPKKLDYQKTIMDMSMKVVSVLDYQRLLEIINDTIVNIVGASSFALLLHDEESDAFMPIATYGVDSAHMMPLQPMHDLLRFVRLLNREIFKDDLEEDGEILSPEILTVFDSYRASFVIPMTYQASLKGVLFIGERKNNDLYTLRDVELLKILANHIVIALDNARLYELAIRDGLTRLYISRFFQQRISEEILNTIRAGRFLSFLMIDIDHFKMVNDTYGHQKGDQLLKELAHIITDQVRVVDIAARYGGEEFAIILPETDNAHAMAIAERIRKKVENTEFGMGIRQTVSIGVVTLDGKKASDREVISKNSTRTAVRVMAESIKTEMIQIADKAPYDAKKTGRNKCVNGGITGM